MTDRNSSNDRELDNGASNKNGHGDSVKYERNGNYTSNGHTNGYQADVDEKMAVSIYHSNGKHNGGDDDDVAEANEKETFEIKHVSDIIGDTGWFQRAVCSFHTLMGFCVTYFNLGISFYAPSNLDYRCVSNGTHSLYDTGNVWTQVGNETVDKCPVGCTEWVYDKKYFDRTVTSEFDLVCDRSWVASASQAVYMAGILISSLIASPIGDRYGRASMVRIGLVGESIVGWLLVFVPNLYAFLACRFFLAFLSLVRGMSAGVISKYIQSTDIFVFFNSDFVQIFFKWRNV